VAEKRKESSGTKRRGSRPAAPAVVSVTTQGGPFKGVSTAVVRRRASKMLSHLALQGVELSVALVNDEAIHELNRSYRRKDKPTDVLSFPGDEDGEGYLGDILISVPTARRQAAGAGHPVDRELRVLLLHGVLHCLGFDHETDDGEMERLERRLRKRWIDRPAAAAGKEADA